MDLRFLAGPLVGSVIGYFTNYLAVKMLFRPRTEIKIFGHALPFTPGVIPKGKQRLAKAAGGVVGNTLLTKEDILGGLLSEEMEHLVSGQIMAILSKEIREELLELTKLEEEGYECQKEKVISVLCEQIQGTLEELPIGEVIARECVKAVSEKLTGGFLSMFVSDDLLDSLIAPMGEKIQQHIEENGISYIQPVLTDKITQLEQSAAIDVLAAFGVEASQVEHMVLPVYRDLVEREADKLLGSFDIPKIVEDKINAMDVMELERLVLSVMEQELHSIVNLGAIIGFLIGLLNIAFLQ